MTMNITNISPREKLYQSKCLFRLHIICTLISDTPTTTVSYLEGVCVCVCVMWHLTTDYLDFFDITIVVSMSYLCSTPMYTLVLCQWHVIILISVEYLFLSVCQQPVCCISVVLSVLGL